MSGHKQPVILFVNHWASALGGAERSLIDIITEVSTRGSAVLVASEAGILLEKARAVGATCTVIPCSKGLSAIRRDHVLLNCLGALPSLISYLFFIGRLTLFIHRLKPSVVHANVPKSHVSSGVACAILRIPLVLHMREIFSPHNPVHLLYRFVSPFVTTCIAISHAVKNALPASLRTKTAVIYNGVTISPAARTQSTGLPVTCVCLGRISRWKGCHELIDIFAGVVRAHGTSAATLTFVGDTLFWHTQYLQELKNQVARYALTKNITFVSTVPEPLSELIKYDIFCTAAHSEPFGRAPAEAMGCGLPVIGYADGGLVEVVDSKSGILVQPYDTQAFTDALSLCILNRALRITLGEHGRQRAAQNFNSEKQRVLIANRIFLGA